MKFSRGLLLVAFASLLVSCNVGETSSSSSSEEGISSSEGESSEPTSSESSSQSSSESSSESSSSSSEASSEEPSSSSEPAPINKTQLAYTYQDYTYNNVYNLSACPSVGDVKIVVVPVWFTDSSTYISTTGKDNIIGDIDNVFFGSESSTGWHSLSSFYYEESGGLLNIQGTVTDWYECGYSSSQVGSSTSGGTLTNSIVSSATEWFFTNNPDKNRKDYDYDGDGYLDAVCLIYGAPDYSAAGSSYANFWAYTYWLQGYNADVDTPNPNAYFWGSYDFIYGSTNARSRTGSNYASGDTRNMTSATNPVDSHTLVHEFGHVLGLTDYYDCSYQYSPVGGFTMQDSNVGGHDPFSVMALGWSSPYIPTESCTIEIGAFQSTKDLILLTPEWNEYDSPFDEYILVELYTPTSLNEFDTDYIYKYTYPQGVDATGIRLWHVDARLAVCTGVDQNQYPVYSDELTSNPVIDESVSNDYGRYHGLSNTYLGSSGSSYLSPMGSDYYNYNILQLLSNTSRGSYYRSSSFSRTDLFFEGDSFRMVNLHSQFVNSLRLNNGSSLGWSFSVSINGEGEDATATIELTRS